ncbi:hypothetical protein QL285_050685 [Trifolium repens]|jgi:hypothetical protein|nr:hypothetical protein QL285_050685 [Trifolium repens]
MHGRIYSKLQRLQTLNTVMTMGSKRGYFPKVGNFDCYMLKCVECLLGLELFQGEVEFNMGKLNTFPPWTSCIFTLRSNKEHIFIIDTQHYI